MQVKAGQSAFYERTFTAEDVRSFAEISGDRGVHHMQPDGAGRIMVQGLLTATLPTKLGGDMNYIARDMKLQFLRPVFVGDRIRCDATVTKADPAEGHLNLSIEIVCRNQDGKEVLTGETRGIVQL